MENQARSESRMWEEPARPAKSQATDDEINEKYTSREWRIVTESNREQLPNFVEALKRPDWMEVRPFYQRRERWTPKRQSLLIESFIMNIPVPPLFVYESGLARYEVMDGQQRISAIRSFYANELKLRGLQQWPELNGRTYSTLPSEIKKGIDRRSISYIVLLQESAQTTEEQTLLRQLVFERLNTGGVRLAQQEIRNCLYQGPFNELLFELSRCDLWRRAWSLPEYSPAEEENPPQPIHKEDRFAKMGEVEAVLRAFALRHVKHYQRGMQGFLDIYMVRAMAFEEEDLAFLRDMFLSVVKFAAGIYGDLLFHPIKDGEWSAKPQVAYADAVMVGICRHLQHGPQLLARRKEVVAATREMFLTNEPGTFTGRGNTKTDLEDRLGKFDTMLSAVLGA
jgi:Protein of unknown function DUF262